MSFDYSGLATKAQALIERFGQDVTVSVRAIASSDPVEGTVSSTEPSSTAKAVIFDYSLQDSGKTFARDVVIEKGDKKCLIAGISPTLNTKIAVAGISYQVVNIKELNPGGTSLYYELQLRK